VFNIEPNDLVLNIVFAWEGAIAVASDSETGMVASHRFPTFLHSEQVDLDYLLMVLQSAQARSLMAINSPGAAGRNRTIRLGQFLDEEVPLPSLFEQRQMVDAFRTDEKRLDALLANVRIASERLKEFRTALISAAVTGKIDVRDAAA
jgi:type I restriction enzyme S subunit